MVSKPNSIKKVLLILKSFLPENRPKGILELCKDLEMKPSTMSRILNILKKYDFIQQDKNRKYQLGEVIRMLGKSVKISKIASLIVLIKPHLIILNNKLNESVFLEMLIDNYVKIMIMLEGEKSVHPVRNTDGLQNINSSAGSKAILAFLSPDRYQIVKKSYPVLKKNRPNSISDWNKLEIQLKEIKETGLAYEIDESMEGICALSTPIFNSKGIVFAAVTIPVPLQRKDIIFDPVTINSLKETANCINSLHLK